MNQDLKTMRDPMTYRFLQIIWFMAVIVIIITSAYGLTETAREYMATGNITIGQSMAEMDYPFTYFAKPITYLSAAVVIFTYTTFKLYEKWISNIPEIYRSILIVSSLVVAFGSSYEVLYNFSIWNALITADVIAGQLNIDILNVPYPDPDTPWNLVFATKGFFALAVSSSYSLYALQKIGQSIE